MMAELGSHQLDAASIFIAAVHGGVKQHPLTVAGAGNRPLFPADREIEDHVCCIFEFPAPGYDANDPSPPRRRSASNTPRSTATASAATAKPCWEPKAP